MRLKYKKQKKSIQHYFHLTFFNMFLNIKVKKYKRVHPAPLLPQTPLVDKNFLLQKRCLNNTEHLWCKSGAGFTLIELAVGIALFLFITGASLGIFISIIQNQKKVLAEQQFLNQISYVEEYMSKALRMAKTDKTGDCLKDLQSGDPLEGYIYLLTHEVSGAYKGIKFINQSDNDACQEFFLDTDGILKEIKGTGSPVALTSTNMKINFIRFAINRSDGERSDGSVFGQDCMGNPNQCGASNIDSVQPRVTILLNVKIPGDNQEPNRTIQTTVSRRNLNVNNGQR